MEDDKYIYRAFHPDQIERFDDAAITVIEHTMSGPMYVQWEIVERDVLHFQIIARRLKRNWEK